MTLLYLNLCYKELCYKGTALYNLVWHQTLSFFFYNFNSSLEGTQILNISEYFTGVSSLAEKILIVQPVLTSELGLKRQEET